MARPPPFYGLADGVGRALLIRENAERVFGGGEGFDSLLASRQQKAEAVLTAVDGLQWGRVGFSFAGILQLASFGYPRGADLR